MFDALYPPGLQWYWRADFVNEISDDAIAQHIRFGEALPTMHSTMHMYPINGAAARVGKNDTAWNYRDAMWAQVIVGVDPDPANKEKIISWTKELLRCGASVFRGRSIRKLPDGRRRRGTREENLRRQLRPAGRDQKEIRSR